MLQFFLFIAMFLMIPAGASAITLPWSTTFNCADYSQVPGYGSPGCDGINKLGDWKCSTGDVINSAHNNANGGGGKGFGHEVCDGLNANGGGFSLSFSTTSEFWIRWYMRYQLGSHWSPLQDDKHLYVRAVGNTSQSVAEFVGSNGYRIYVQGGGGEYLSNGVGWQNIMGGSDGDGLWHCYEIHMKMDTNGSNGIYQFWTDGVLRSNFTNVGHGTKAGWDAIDFLTNGKYPANGGRVWVDVDDIAIGTTGRIGPIGNPPINKIPSAPHIYPVQ